MEGAGLSFNVVADDRGWFTTLAGSGAFGASLVAILAYFIKIGVEGHLERKQRRRRFLEIFRALRSEIADTKRRVAETYLNPTPDGSPRERMAMHFRRAEMTGIAHIPYLTVVSSDLMWETVKPELTKFDNFALDEIARFYYADRLLLQALSDLRSEAYKNLPIPRQHETMMLVYDWYVPELIDAAEKAIVVVRRIEKRFDSRRATQKLMRKFPATLLRRYRLRSGLRRIAARAIRPVRS